jgi:hypothetical protein
MGITVPTSARFMNENEYAIVQRVMGNTLPYRIRIVITNGAGVDNRPFTIPTSLVTSLLGAAASGFMAPIAALGGYLTSFMNLAYLMNVGSAYPDMSSKNQDLLVHETTHVWQGKNSTLSQTYVYNSVINQCMGTGSAYAYKPGADWGSYNVEQQASIVEDWFVSGEPTSGNLFGYVRDFVRKGKTS